MRFLTFRRTVTHALASSACLQRLLAVDQSELTAVNALFESRVILLFRVHFLLIITAVSSSVDIQAVKAVPRLLATWHFWGQLGERLSDIHIVHLTVNLAVGEPLEVGHRASVQFQIVALCKDRSFETSANL